MKKSALPPPSSQSRTLPRALYRPLALALSLAGMLMQPPAFAAAPVVSSTTPANSSLGSTVPASLTLAFASPVVSPMGPGTSFTIYRNGVQLESFDTFSSGQIVLSGASVTVTPSVALTPGNYYVLIDSGAWLDVGDSTPFAGLSNVTDWAFTIDQSPPQPLSTFPNGNSTLSGSLSVSFDETVVAGTGSISLRRTGDGAEMFAVNVAGSDVNISGSGLTISHAPQYMPTGPYYFSWPAGAVLDLAGNPVDPPPTPPAVGSLTFNVIDSTPPTANAADIHWDDRDGSGSYSPGDSLSFSFSEPVQLASAGTVNNSHSLGGATPSQLSPVFGYASSFEYIVPASGWTAVAGDALGFAAGDVSDMGGNSLSAALTFTLPAADDLPPRLTASSVVASQPDRATVSLSASEKAAVHWGLFHSSSEVCPPVASLMTSPVSGALQSGSSLLSSANTSQTLSLSGLTASHGYLLCLVAADAAGNSTTTRLAKFFSTPAIPPVTPEPPPSTPSGPLTTPAGTATPVQQAGDVFDNTPGSGVYVNSQTGAVVVPASASNTPLQLKDSSPENVAIQPPRDVAVTFVGSGGGSVRVTAQSADTTLVTRKVGNVLALEVASGTARLEPAAGSGAAIPLGGGNGKPQGVLTPQGSEPVAVTVRRNSDGIAAFVEQGSTAFSSSGSGFSTTTVEMFAGETGAFSSQGQLNKLRLGSLDGDRKLPGDPLPPPPGAEPGLVLPQLGGKVARLAGASLLDLLQTQMDTAFGLSGSSLNFDVATGLLVYRVGTYEARFMPVGELLVSLTAFASNGFTASNAGATVTGAFSLTNRGVQVTLNSALGYFSDFDAALKRNDPKGKLTLKKDGALMLDLNDRRFYAIPGYLTEPSGVVGSPELLIGDNSLSFRDQKGGVQRLYPAVAELSRLRELVDGAAPGTTLIPSNDGSLSMQAGASRFTLRPNFEVKPASIQYFGQYWWVDQGQLFYRLPGGPLVQGLAIQ